MMFSPDRSILCGTLLLAACLACRDEARQPHVFRAPPPPPAPAAAPAPAAPEMPAGSNPLADFRTVYDPATGAAVALDQLPEHFAMLVIAARGPAQAAPLGRSRLELYFDGSRDTTLVLELGEPAPSVVAHAFEVRGLSPGRYGVTVRLADDRGIMVRSTPLIVEVLHPSSRPPIKE